MASRNVGFHIYTNMCSFSCDDYKFYFNLQSNGGANWVIEAKKYFLEEESQWTKVVNINHGINHGFLFIYYYHPFGYFIALF
jgi:hypothetical protein